MCRPRLLRAFVIALAVLSLTGCTRRVYRGPTLAPDRIALVDVGNAAVRDVDGRFRYVVPFGMKTFELAPGPHQIDLGFEIPAQSIGVRDLPARRGKGICTIDFVAEAGKEYRLGVGPTGTGWATNKWKGNWEGWIIDTSRSDDDNIIARCTPSVRKRARRVSAPVVASVPTVPVLPVPAAPAPNQDRVALPVDTAPAPVPVAPVPPVPPAVVAAAAPAATSTALAAAPVADDEAGEDGDDDEEAWIRLGTWNVDALGTDKDRDYEAIAIAIDRNFDILTLTEIAYAEGGAPGYYRLISALGSEWAGMVTGTPRPNVESSDAEYYAVVYRRDAVRPCVGWERLHYFTDNDGSANGIGPDRFRREPAFTCFEAGFGDDDTTVRVDFMLAAYRARWADGDTEAIAEEVDHIDDVFAAMSVAREHETDLVIAGQLNLESVELRTVTAAADRTQGTGSALNLLGNPSHGLGDHILVHSSRATAEMIGNGSVLDVREVAGSPREFRRTVSDHLPVMVRIRSSGPDDD